MIYQKAMVVMRAQPPHKAHFALIQRALEVAHKVVIVLGSSYHARTTRNPFTAAERECMIKLGLDADELMRIEFLPVRDYYDNARWVDAIRTTIEPTVSSPRDLVIVGHEKDSTSSYLRDFPGWNQELIPSVGSIDATSIREAMFEAKDTGAALQAFADILDPRVIAYLNAHLQRPEWNQLRAERALHQAEAEKWGRGPYERFVLCGDALLQWQDQVLLIRRGPGTGAGLLAIPGGHVERGETTLPTAIRELIEEVGIGMLPEELMRGLKGMAFLEDPNRSQRPGRVVSACYHFVINSEKRPQTEKVSDEATPIWVNIEEVPVLEHQFFDDHFMAIDHFIGVT